MRFATEAALIGTWQMDLRTSKMTWSEINGPAVEIPRHRGFGTRLIERSLAQDLQGQATIDFARTGIVCTVDAPIA